MKLLSHKQLECLRLIVQRMQLVSNDGVETHGHVSTMIVDGWLIYCVVDNDGLPVLKGFSPEACASWYRKILRSRLTHMHMGHPLEHIATDTMPS
jgi:hypothetical protein